MLQTSCFSFMRGHTVLIYPIGEGGPSKHSTLLVSVSPSPSEGRHVVLQNQFPSVYLLSLWAKMVWETSGSEKHWVFLNFFLWGPAPLLPFTACSCHQEIEDSGWKALGLLGRVWQPRQWDEQLTSAELALTSPLLQRRGGGTLIFRFPELSWSLLI